MSLTIQTVITKPNLQSKNGGKLKINKEPTGVEKATKTGRINFLGFRVEPKMGSQLSLKIVGELTLEDAVNVASLSITRVNLCKKV